MIVFQRQGYVKKCLCSLLLWEFNGEVKRNFQVDDIVLIRFQGKVPPAEFRMAIVKETYPDVLNRNREILEVGSTCNIV